MTKPEVLLATASGSNPVGSAAMLMTSVESARAATGANSSPAATARKLAPSSRRRFDALLLMKSSLLAPNMPSLAHGQGTWERGGSCRSTEVAHFSKSAINAAVCPGSGGWIPDIRAQGDPYEPGRRQPDPKARWS